MATKRTTPTKKRVRAKTSPAPGIKAKFPRHSVGKAIRIAQAITDAWQPVERRYRLSRGILAELVHAQYPGVVSVLTKSPIILDDLDLLKALPTADVGITITTTNDHVGRLLEARAPSASRRIKTLASLNSGGVHSYAFIGPLLPHFCEQRGALEDLFKSVHDAGTTQIYVELINKSRYIRERLDEAYVDVDSSLKLSYIDADELQQRSRLVGMVNELVARYSFKLRLGRVIDHRRDLKKKDRIV